MTTWKSTTTHAAGDEVPGCMVVVDGDLHAARVRIDGIASQEQIERPSWLDADSAGGRQYPLTETTYEVTVLRSRPAVVSGNSDAVEQHVGNLRGDS